MADVILETTGTNDLRPKGVNGENRNLIPHVANPDPPEGTNALGTPDDPWYGATIGSENFTLLFHANRGAERILMGFEVIPNWATMTARINMIQLDTESALAVLSLRQMAETSPMIVFAGTEGNNFTATISTRDGSGSNVVGPKDGLGGWKFAQKMIKVDTNGGPYWMPLFEPN